LKVLNVDWQKKNVKLENIPEKLHDHANPSFLHFSSFWSLSFKKLKKLSLLQATASLMKTLRLV
jgi:hypothetical protein